MSISAAKPIDGASVDNSIRSESEKSQEPEVEYSEIIINPLKNIRKSRLRTSSEQKRSSSPRDGSSAPEGGALTGSRKASADSIYTYEAKSQDPEAEKYSMGAEFDREYRTLAKKCGEEYAILMKYC